MIAYIYKITNILNGKVYIGKTHDLNKRILQHFSDLKKGKHHSRKLQRAVDKYGIDNFKISFKEVEVLDEDALSLLEIQEIEKCDSYNNGYNETLGGDGNKTSLSFKESILVYQILQRYKGVNRQIARYFSCDHTVIDNLAKNELYARIEFDEDKMDELIKEIGLEDQNKNENYVAHNNKKLDHQQCLEFLSVIMQKTGYDKTMSAIFDVDSKLAYRLKNKQIYKDVIKEFEIMTQEEKTKLLEDTMKKYKVDAVKAQRKRNGIKNALTQEQVNYILDNKNKKTRVQIGLDLGISADRVGAVILGKSYKDLIANYHSQ